MNKCDECNVDIQKKPSPCNSCMHNSNLSDNFMAKPEEPLHCFARVNHDGYIRALYVSESRAREMMEFENTPSDKIVKMVEKVDPTKAENLPYITKKILEEIELKGKLDVYELGYKNAFKKIEEILTDNRDHYLGKEGTDYFLYDDKVLCETENAKTVLELVEKME